MSAHSYAVAPAQALPLPPILGLRAVPQKMVEGEAGRVWGLGVRTRRGLDSR